MNEALTSRLEDHMNTDDRNFDRIATTFEKVVESLEKITTLDEKLGKLEATLVGRIGTLETNQDWLLKWFWLLASTTVVGLLGFVGNLIYIVLKIN